MHLIAITIKRLLNGLQDINNNNLKKSPYPPTQQTSTQGYLTFPESFANTEFLRTCLHCSAPKYKEIYCAASFSKRMETLSLSVSLNNCHNL